MFGLFRRKAPIYTGEVDKYIVRVYRESSNMGEGFSRDSHTIVVSLTERYKGLKTRLGSRSICRMHN